MKVSKLEGPILDFWVARAMGHQPRIVGGCEIIDWNRLGTKVNGCRFQPSTDWQHGGRIIEREQLTVQFMGSSIGTWRSYAPGWDDRDEFGETALMASMRAYVASKFGEEVPDEEEQE